MGLSARDLKAQKTSHSNIWYILPIQMLSIADQGLNGLRIHPHVLISTNARLMLRVSTNVSIKLETMNVSVQKITH
jgi:hypothetical protein